METLLKKEDRGERVPALENMPVLFPHLQFYWEAFWSLQGSRRMGFGVGPIPVSEMKDYLEIMGETDSDEVRRFMRYISELDAVYLKKMNERAKSRTRK